MADQPGGDRSPAFPKLNVARNDEVLWDADLLEAACRYEREVGLDAAGREEVSRRLAAGESATVLPAPEHRDGTELYEVRLDDSCVGLFWATPSDDETLEVTVLFKTSGRPKGLLKPAMKTFVEQQGHRPLEAVVYSCNQASAYLLTVLVDTGFVIVREESSGKSTVYRRSPS